MHNIPFLLRLIACVLLCVCAYAGCKSETAAERTEATHAREHQASLQTPTPPTPQQHREEKALSTALMVVQMTPKGELSVGHLQPRPHLAWVDRLVPFDASHHKPHTGSPPSTTSKEVDTPHWDLVVIAEHPSLAAPVVFPLQVLAPERDHGDVVDPWRTGGAVWRVPWAGDGTRYRVLRLHPYPAVSLTEWEAKT